MQSKIYLNVHLILGIGNLLVTAAGELASIPFPKLKRFAYILNLPFIEKTTYYRLRGIILFRTPPFGLYNLRIQQTLYDSSGFIECLISK